MYTKNSYRLLVVVFMTILAALPLAAQGYRGGAPHAGTSAISNPPVIAILSGTVQNVDFQYGMGYPNFELKTNDGLTYVIFVGPLRYLDDNDFELQAGDEVKAGIFPDPQNNNSWVAAVLDNLSTGQSLTLRDASGLPLWIRRSSSGHSGLGGGLAKGAGSGQSMHQGQGPGALRSGPPSIDLTTLETYVGRVTKVNIVAGDPHPSVEVSLQSGNTAVFCLGPWRYLDQIGFAVNVGDSVVIKAADCSQDTDEYVVCSITIGGQTWIMRNDDGTPKWYFGNRG